MKTIFYLVIFTSIFLIYGCNNKVDFTDSFMEMNKPDYLLKDSVFWNENESLHFKCFSSKKVDNEIVTDILDNQEKNIIHISKLMQIDNIDTLSKINIWVFKNDNEKYLKTQVKSNAHCLTEYWSVYYNKGNATGAHEVGHLMSQYFWGYTKNDKYDFLLNEGFAFYVDEALFYKIDFYKKAKKLLQQEKYKISNIVKHNNNEDYRDKAFVCGAFDKYLIEIYGINKFSKLWISDDDDIIFNSIYDKSLKELEDEFYDFIKKLN